ncbi:hypothetical protein [Bacteroides congonensis]|uniref:hypothetical protein n=1 Tax=Bacteroides congonensis TaxID=1871006 RepID=UPI002665ED2D|nr:hypothetical protein [Bacteroides congonensis]
MNVAMPLLSFVTSKQVRLKWCPPMLFCLMRAILLRLKCRKIMLHPKPKHRPSLNQSTQQAKSRYATLTARKHAVSLPALSMKTATTSIMLRATCNNSTTHQSMNLTTFSLNTLPMSRRK